MLDVSFQPVLRVGRTSLSRRGDTAVIVVVSLLLTSLLMYWSYLVKIKCGGPPFLEGGRSSHWPVGDPDAVIPCYSDLMFLWKGRGIDEHIFPYIHGGINADGKLFGGVVEYPVLSGMMMWLGAIGAHTDTEFFQHSVWLLIPFSFAITVLLALLVRWWVLFWAATPPLVLYSFHNWELPVTATAVAAVAVMAWGAGVSPKTGRRRLSLRTSAILASILLALGFCLKIYPGLFVLPLALYVLTRGEAEADDAHLRDTPTVDGVPPRAASTGEGAEPRAASSVEGVTPRAASSGEGVTPRRLRCEERKRRASKPGETTSNQATPNTDPLDWFGAAWVAAAAGITVIVVQLPFMILGFDGWKAALSFQGQRKADVDTNSIWYWGLRHFTDGQNSTYNSLVGVLSPLLILAAFALSIHLGRRYYERLGTFPWIGVAASMLAGFMLFHKVHSPQYTLWILPFFVLLQIRWPVIVAYLVADFVLDTTIFRLFGIYTSGSDMKWWVVGGVNFGVWVHAVVLSYLIFAFVKSPPREPLRSMLTPKSADSSVGVLSQGRSGVPG
ncbi:hypothetical protein M2359_000466 [Gordonia amarae]|uniref:DUF2029 domain-containing protein n=1 Tax=Gordonia amarae NBRC 15530 TaxID=1075090 RepID=G7GKZ2_9ACTN|nr:hypothetical protein [Gordonia amarae]MCS3876837.1 hypothetical protein [Gordonia amarae]GAB04267.1 hypothetical protein GOAMR_15_00490 [Gordonia amarae NBRC 15530]